MDQEYTNDIYTEETRTETRNPDKKYSVIALVLGIISLLLCCFSILGLIPGIISIIFAVKARKNGETGAMPVVSIVFSVIGIVFAVISTIFILFVGVISYEIYSEWEETGILEQIENMNEDELQEFLENNQMYYDSKYL